MTPKGARGRAAVARLGRTKKTGGFAKIERSVEAKGGSKESAAKIAGAQYWNMVRKHGG
jgi:hypothetical protein